MTIMAIFFSALMSLVISLITSAIVKKDPNPFDSAMKNVDESQNINN